MAENALERLRAYYNESTPLGPIEALRFDQQNSFRPTGYSQIYRATFDEQNELFRELNQYRSIIVGRKGAGKTSLLVSSVVFDESNDTIVIEGQDIAPFVALLGKISDMSPGVALVEQMANVWEFLLYSVAMVKLPKYRSDSISKYISGLRSDNPNLHPYEIMESHLKVVAELPPSEHPIPQKIRFTKINDVNFLQAKHDFSRIIAERKKKVYICVDSLEDLEFDGYGWAPAIAGFLRVMGQSSAERGVVVLRCCIPAEHYFNYMKTSTNPIKDFQGQILLHWAAGDLLKLTAKRYQNFLRLNGDRFQHPLLVDRPVETRLDALNFWKHIFPEPFTNMAGFEENVVPYIIRHTQLLPRHMILILSKILEASLKQDQKAWGISASHAVDGVRAAESLISSQIIEAYKSSTKTPESISDALTMLLSNLKTHFTWSEFDKVVSNREKGRITSVLGLSERVEVLEFFIQIGAIGRFIDETDRYKIAIFEYMVPSRLVPGAHDTFCIHPVFTAVFNAQSRYIGAKPIYGHWSRELPEELQ